MISTVHQFVSYFPHLHELCTRWLSVEGLVWLCVRSFSFHTKPTNTPQRQQVWL